jgi:hypothetical protein
LWDWSWKNSELIILSSTSDINVLNDINRNDLKTALHCELGVMTDIKTNNKIPNSLEMYNIEKMIKFNGPSESYLSINFGVH